VLKNIKIVLYSISIIKIINVSYGISQENSIWVDGKMDNLDKVKKMDKDYK